jgi:signal transduction histidine kinase
LASYSWIERFKQILHSAGTLPTDFGVKDELTDLAETFNDLIGRLRDALQRERHFRADAAHNMFTPLTAVQSELDVTLRNSRSEEEYREALRTVQHHTKTLSSLLGELMTLLRIEARDDRPPPTLIDVSRQVEDRIRRVRQAHPEAASVEWQGDSGIEAPVSSEDLNLVVDHLLDNALKYTPEEGHVTVQVAKREDDVVLRVLDSGIGFDAEAADRLFEPFYRTGATARARRSNRPMERARVPHREGDCGKLRRNGDGLELRSGEGQHL